MTNTEIKNVLKNEVLETYPINGINIIIPSESNYTFQLTTTTNEYKTINNSLLNDNDMSMLNLKKCESLLKQKNNIPQDNPLIILKFEKQTNIAREKNIQYEIYNPITFDKLNIDICGIIDIIIPIKLDEEIEDLSNSLKKEGYDLFNENDKFYNDICTPFTSKNGADVTLDDRKIYFYTKILNTTTCPKDCEYSEFIFDLKAISCKCKINNDNIDINKMDLLYGDINYNPKLIDKKYTSYKTMKCYNLVFSSKYFIKNIGSIIASVILTAYIIFMIYFIIKEISPLKLLISKNLFDEYPKIKEINPFMKKIEKGKKSQKKKFESKSLKQSTKKESSKHIIKMSKNDLSNPPKKSRAKQVRINSAEKRIDTENIKLVDLVSKNKKKKFGKSQNLHNIKNKKHVQIKSDKKEANIDVESLKSDKVRKRKSIFDYLKEREHRIKIEKSQQKEQEKEKDKEFILINTNEKKSKNKNNKNKTKEASTEVKKILRTKEKEKKNKILDDYELNHLEYEDALEQDKRGFCKTYWSIIKRDELFIFTFISWNDYNLFYVKIERFLFIILNIMVMNVLFFSEESIHEFFINGVKYNFSKQILQIVLAIIITHIFEILLCYLTLTDRYIYEIKSLENPEENRSIIFGIIKKIRIKLIVFLIIFFLVSIFYWYFISSFCAVYNNTQKMYLIDCALSFVFFLIDPFIVYGLITFIRILSIRKICNKNIKCLFKIGHLFPIF